MSRVKRSTSSKPCSEVYEDRLLNESEIRCEDKEEDKDNKFITGFRVLL
jgi:hypothetical protein